MSNDPFCPCLPPLCLQRRRPSRQKGGTLIAEEVTDLAMHNRRLSSPGGYRPVPCANCGHDVLHVHDYPERVLYGDDGPPVVRIVRYLCMACQAIWRILPRFLARHLWRTWRVVEEQTVAQPPPSTRPAVPERTVRRWWARLRSAARLCVEVLASSASPRLEKLAHKVGLDGTRQELVLAYASAHATPAGRPLADLAALLHRLVPGVRLM